VEFKKIKVMSKSKLALDNSSERELLIDLWNIEEMIENNEPEQALKAIKALIEEVRYSEIIDSYTLFDVLDNAREEDLLDTVITITKKTPNDMELGKEIRNLFRA
jgi:hypothetical protein